MRIRGILARIAAFCFGLVVAVLIAEVAVRVLTPAQITGRWVTLDKRYGFFHRPNFSETLRYKGTNVVWRVEINSLGLRDKEYDLSRTNVLRVLLLGDSFTFGYGLSADQIFDEKLERLLNDAGIPAYVINGGVAGWGTLQEVTFARDHFSILRPDIVVLTFSENDQNDDIVYQKGAAGGLLPNFPGKRFIRDHFVLYTHLYRAAHGWLFSRVIVPEGGPQVGRPIAPAEKQRLEEAWSRQKWQSTLRILQDFRYDLLAFNPRGVLVLQAAEPFRDDVRAHLQSLEDRKTIYFVDLKADAEQLGRENITLGYDPHWSPAMHLISARRLFEKIQAILADRAAAEDRARSGET